MIILFIPRLVLRIQSHPSQKFVLSILRMQQSKLVKQNSRTPNPLIHLLTMGTFHIYAWILYTNIHCLWMDSVCFALVLEQLCMTMMLFFFFAKSMKLSSYTDFFPFVGRPRSIAGYYISEAS